MNVWYDFRQSIPIFVLLNQDIYANFFLFQLILRLLFICPHITDMTEINPWAFPCGVFIFLQMGKRYHKKSFKLDNRVLYCYSLKDCNYTAHTSIASLQLTCELFPAEFPRSTADGKMMFIFLFNRSLICRWTGDQISISDPQNFYWCLENSQFALCTSSVWYSSYLAVPHTVKKENQDSLEQIITSVLHLL